MKDIDPFRSLLHLHSVYVIVRELGLLRSLTLVRNFYYNTIACKMIQLLKHVYTTIQFCQERQIQKTFYSVDIFNIRSIFIVPSSKLHNFFYSLYQHHICRSIPITQSVHISIISLQYNATLRLTKCFVFKQNSLMFSALQLGSLLNF